MYPITIRELCRIYVVHPSTYYRRRERHWSHRAALIGVRWAR